MSTSNAINPVNKRMNQLFSNFDGANRQSKYLINPEIKNRNVKAALKALSRYLKYKEKSNPVVKRILTSAIIQLKEG